MRQYLEYCVQRMVCLSLHIAISPALRVSGLLYLFYPNWSTIGFEGWSPGIIPLVHTAAAFALIAFLIVHIYMSLTTSEEPFAYLKAMITGYEKE